MGLALSAAITGAKLARARTSITRDLQIVVIRINFDCLNYELSNAATHCYKCYYHFVRLAFPLTVVVETPSGRFLVVCMVTNFSPLGKVTFK